MNIRLAALAFLVTGVTAQQPTPPAKPVVLPAVNSQIGGAYPIDELEHTLTYSLESVAVASRFTSADKNIVAPAGKRLLIVTSNVTNPQTHAYPLGGDLLVVNAFAANGDRSLSTDDSFILPGLTSFPTNLKPKEKLRFVTVLQVHGQGPIPRIAIVKGSRQTRRAWYDIDKNLGTIASVFADGAGLRDRAETTTGQTFDLGPFDMVVESAGPAAGGTSYAVNLKVTNVLHAPEQIGWQYAKPTLTDATGKELSWNSDLIDIATGKSVVAELPAGQPHVLQYVFSGERGRSLKTFTLAMNGGRTIVVNLK